MKIYVASSWRNEHQQSVVNFLRECGHEVYDFKKPSDGKAGFHWSEIDPNWKSWTTQQYREALRHEYAQFGFNRDFDAMEAADACVLVLPCGRSAHLEAGWMKGAGKTVFAYIPDGEAVEPELMYNMLDGVTSDINEIAQLLSKTPENDKSATATITTVKQKAIAAIASEIRARAGAWPDEKLKQYDLRLADRIEEAAEQDCEDAERRGNHAAMKAICETIEKVGPLYDAESVGNTAKLREVVGDLLYMAERYVKKTPATESVIFDAKTKKEIRTVNYYDVIAKAQAALAAPPRNCDLYADEQSAWEAFSEKRQGPDSSTEEYEQWLFEKATA